MWYGSRSVIADLAIPSYVDHPARNVTHWMCPEGHPGTWYGTTCTECGGRFTRVAYCELRCPWCPWGDLGWRKYADGVTRRCACAHEDFPMPLPLPELSERLSAFMLWTILGLPL